MTTDLQCPTHGPMTRGSDAGSWYCPQCSSDAYRAETERMTKDMNDLPTFNPHEVMRRLERLRKFGEAAVMYVALLQTGMTPSNPKYWPYTDAYRNALADLGPGGLLADPTPPPSPAPDEAANVKEKVA